MIHLAGMVWKRDGVLLHELLGLGPGTLGADSEEGDGLLGLGDHGQGLVNVGIVDLRLAGMVLVGSGPEGVLDLMVRHVVGDGQDGHTLVDEAMRMASSMMSGRVAGLVTSLL